MKFGIVGLGLMGGSFAKSIRKYNLSSQIVGYDHNIEHQKDALALQLVDEIVDIEQLLLCDVIILSIPVDAIVKFLPFLVDVAKSTTIIDFGSTKKMIVEHIPESLKQQYIPAHPMTGTEKFGPKAAIDDLYKDKIMVLCDLENVEQLHKNRAIEIFKTLQMKLVFMNSNNHDLHACYISHLPHVVSFALANFVMSNEDPKNIVSLAAGGFKSMSRIAKSSPDMWTDIFRQNRTNLLKAISSYKEQLTQIETILEDENYQEMKKWIQQANKLHEII